MRLTTKLLGYLNRVFDKDPHPFLAFTIGYDGGLAWQVADGVLTTTVSGGVGQGLSLDLSQYTIQGLVEYIAGQAGYTLFDLDPDRAQLSALVLLDGSGDLSQPNGGQIAGYTSLLFAWLEAIGFELAEARSNVAAAPAMMDITQAQGAWLDVLGSYYDQPRAQGQSDALYAPAIIAAVLTARQNNVAIEMAIEAQTGQAATVTDVVKWTQALALHDGSEKYDGTRVYSTHPVANYGLFDVVTAYDLLNLVDPLSFQQQVAAICDAFRAAGTHLRAVAFQGSQLSDSFTDEPTDSSVASVGFAATDQLSEPGDASRGALTYAAVDYLTPPNDMTDNLVILTQYLAQDGTPLYATTTTETLAGDQIVSVTPPVPVQVVSQGGSGILDQSGDYLLED